MKSKYDIPISGSELAKAILRIPLDMRVNEMSLSTKRDYWCLTKMFGKLINKTGSRGTYKTNGGRGVQLLAKRILRDAILCP